MGWEERKLRVIRLCMDITNEDDLQKVEELLANVRLNSRAGNSERDIDTGKVDDFQKFSAEMKEWIKEKKRTA